MLAGVTGQVERVQGKYPNAGDIRVPLEWATKACAVPVITGSQLWDLIIVGGVYMAGFTPVNTAVVGCQFFFFFFG